MPTVDPSESDVVNAMACCFLYVIGELRAGGSERQLYYLLKNLDRRLYPPEVLVWNFDETAHYVSRIRALGVPIHSFPCAFSGTRKLVNFRRLVIRVRPEIIHSFSFHTNFAAFWASRGIQTLAIGGVRSDFHWAKMQTGPLLGRLSARWPRKQIFNSVAAAKAVSSSKSLFRPKKCWVVRNGLDFEHFPNTPTPNVGLVVIAAVGSLYPVKRWDRLIAITLALKERNFDFRLRIVGDGPLRMSLRQQAQDRGAADKLQFVGHMDDIPKFISEASFLVHTSESEGCPNAVMEAMACGRAVVATDVGDIALLVDDMRTGFVVHPSDDAMLIDRIAALIVNRDLCSMMGRAARGKVEKEFGLRQVVSDTLEAYKAAGWKD